MVYQTQFVAGAVSSSSSAYAFADKTQTAAFSRPDRRYSITGGGHGSGCTSPLDHIGGGGFGATHFGGVAASSSSSFGFAGVGSLDIHSCGGGGGAHHGFGGHLNSSSGGGGGSCTAREQLEQRLKQWNRTTHSRRVLEDKDALDKTLGRRHSK
jgi:hypothetical protein